MAKAIDDFWPSEIPDPDDPSPVALLKEQAELLADKTQGEIEAVVTMYIEEGIAYHFLFLKPRLFGDFQYRILSISYPVSSPASEVYPITAEVSGHGPTNVAKVTLSNEDEFRSWLRSQLSSESIRSTLGTLKKYAREIRASRAS
jgi:hypothetical protein